MENRVYSGVLGGGCPMPRAERRWALGKGSYCCV